MLLDKISEFYNLWMESWVQADNDKEIYPTQNKGKSVVTERFTRALKNTI